MRCLKTAAIFLDYSASYRSRSNYLAPTSSRGKSQGGLVGTKFTKAAKNQGVRGEGTKKLLQMCLGNEA
jgi:hypothetical protein